MSPSALLSSIESAPRATVRGSTEPALEHLRDPVFIERLTVLGQLSDALRPRLWPPLTGWELCSFTFGAYCPQCCLDDLGKQLAPYGRLRWQQSWCTICQIHSYPLVVRRPNISLSRRHLLGDINFLAANRYRDLKVPPNSKVRFDILAGLVEIEYATANAVRGIPPSRWLWGDLAPDEFLLVLGDVTTWSLMHFESVRAWSAAEDFSPTEEQEGYGIIGRSRRMLASEYVCQNSTRTLSDIMNPKVRGAPFGSPMPSWRNATRLRPTELPVPNHKIDKRRECFVRRPPAGNGWPIDRNTGQQSIGGPGGSMPARARWPQQTAENWPSSPNYRFTTKKKAIWWLSGSAICV